MTTPQQVLDFWLREIGREGWYKGGDEIDAQCKARFGSDVEMARDGAYREWLGRPDGALAYLVLTDQLPRNIHRGTALAFASDTRALAAALLAVSAGLDLAFEGVERQFFYLPFEHAESRQFQSRAVCLFLTRLPGDEDGNLVHARAHREIIHRFGRFPTRNAALGRQSSPAEQAFLDGGGYGAVVKDLGG